MEKNCYNTIAILHFAVLEKRLEFSKDDVASIHKDFVPVQVYDIDSCTLMSLVIKKCFFSIAFCV